MGGQSLPDLRRQVGLRVQQEGGQTLQWEGEPPVEHGTAGELCAVTAGADHCGTDRLVPQSGVLIQTAVADRFAQQRTHIPEGHGGQVLPDAFCHAAGEGDQGGGVIVAGDRHVAPLAGGG